MHIEMRTKKTFERPFATEYVSNYVYARLAIAHKQTHTQAHICRESEWRNRQTRPARSFIIDSCQYWRSCNCMFNSVGMTIIKSKPTRFESKGRHSRVRALAHSFRLCVCVLDIELPRLVHIVCVDAFFVIIVVVDVAQYSSLSLPLSLYSIHNAHCTLYNILFYWFYSIWTGLTKQQQYITHS